MNDNAKALLDRADALHREGRRAEAIELFKQVLATRPESTEGWYELGYLLKAEARYIEALDAYGEALARGVRRPEEVHLNRAVIFSDHLRRDADAERELRSALSCNAYYLPAHLNLGNLHEERGERDLALACYDGVLAMSKEATAGYEDLRLEAFARVANLRPPTSLDDPLLERLRGASVEAAKHSHFVRANLFFALGRAYDKLGAFDLAFDAYAKGNRSLLRDAGRTYDRAHSERLTNAMIQAFEPATLVHRRSVVQGECTPLFICGMFRSGSTLVEQVLAAHPEVTAGGELDYLMRLVTGRLAPFPASMSAANPGRDASLAEEYLAHLAQLFPAAHADKYITDKRPDNFLLIGLIKRLFPQAKIVHSTRHPMDNGLSVFMQHLNPRVAGYASDLGDIGHYYGQYRRLMAHWKTLYADSIYDFEYDRFVAEPEPALRRLFAFLQLPWDQRCLDFHRLGNTVKTASYWQVRRPLYNNASGRWRHYLPHLRPLRDALVEAGIVSTELE